jgi:uncharacterized caspase-like protein
VFRLLQYVVALSATILIGSLPTLAAKRTALVIGHSSYAKVSRLPNPIRDAEAVEAMLKGAGFNPVIRKSDLGAADMKRALREFADHAKDADIAIIYYAGHGIEVNGINYLIPVDAVLERDTHVEDETVSLDRISQALDQVRRLRLMILDSCRDNPFARSIKRTVATRSIGRGLAKVEVTTTDTLVAFAAKAGSTASDGEGSHSPYTAALLKHLVVPGLDVRLALGRVRDEVLKTTSHRQEPFVYGSLGGREIPLVPDTTARREWQDVKNSNSEAVLREYLAKHKGNALYVYLAQERLQKIRENKAKKEKAEAERGARADDKTSQTAETSRDAKPSPAVNSNTPVTKSATSIDAKCCRTQHAKCEKFCAENPTRPQCPGDCAQRLATCTSKGTYPFTNIPSVSCLRS